MNKGKWCTFDHFSELEINLLNFHENSKLKKYIQSLLEEVGM